MTVINVTAALTALGGATPVTSGRITVEYLRGTRGEPAARRDGAEVLLPAPVVATIADGVTTTPLDVPPTDGTCYARIWVEARAPRDGCYLELPSVAIPATGPVDIADLVAVDPASYEPITTVVTAWELAVAEVADMRMEVVLEAGRAASAAMDAGTYAEATEFDANRAGQSAFQAGQSAAAALGHRNAAKDSADAAALAAGSITKDVPGGVPSLDGNARVPDARLPERLGQQALLATIGAVVDDALGDFEPSSGVVVVYHLADAAKPRPATTNTVMWVGSVMPAAFANGDLLAAPVNSTPVDIGPAIPTSGLVAHHRAVDMPLADGAAATAWKNRVSGGAALSVTSGSPTFRSVDGHQYITFDGVDDAMSETGILLAQPSTLIVVGRYRNTTSGQYLIGPTQSGGNRNTLANNGGKYNLYAGNPSLTSTVSVDTVWHLFRAQFNGTSSINAVDTTVTAGQGGPESRRGIRIGQNEQATAFSAVDIAEVIIYNRVLTSDEVAAISAAMTGYYKGLL